MAVVRVYTVVSKNPLFKLEVLYKCGEKLVGERTKRSSLKVKATELLFADDANAVSVDRQTMEELL